MLFDSFVLLDFRQPFCDIKSVIDHWSVIKKSINVDNWLGLTGFNGIQNRLASKEKKLLISNWSRTFLDCVYLGLSCLVESTPMLFLLLSLLLSLLFCRIMSIVLSCICYWRFANKVLTYLQQSTSLPQESSSLDFSNLSIWKIYI